MTKSKQVTPINPEVDYNALGAYPRVSLQHVKVAEETDITPENINPEPLNNFSKMPEEYIERNKISDEEVFPEPLNTNIGIDPPNKFIPPDAVKTLPDELPVERPLTEDEVIAVNKLRGVITPSFPAIVGTLVLCEGTHAAIITKVWNNGLVNLIIFHDESPVPDVKTLVPYGEGPNTWKEIN